MKITCPNDPEHVRFVTVVHVTEDWIVGPGGEFEEVFEGGMTEVVQGPNTGNMFTRTMCGATCEAKDS